MTNPTHHPNYVALAQAGVAATRRQLWKALPLEERAHAVALLLADAETPWARSALVDWLASVNKGFRRQTIASWNRAKLAEEVAKRPLDDAGMLDALLKGLHFPERAHLQVTFFDAAGIAHDQGVVGEDAIRHPATTPERLAAAVDAVLAAHPGDQALFYLLCVAAMEPLAWPGLPQILQQKIA